MKNKVFIILLCLLFTIGCQPSKKTIQTAIAQTQEAIPTATKITFGDIDLREILIQSGDLPSGYEAGQLNYDWPTDIGIPMKVVPDNFIMQAFKEKGDSFNIPHFSMLALYDDEKDAISSYENIVESFEFKIPTPPVAGSSSAILRYQASADTLKFDVTVLVFRRCNSFVMIRTFDIKDDAVFAYAKGLDKRVEKIACQ